MLTVIAYDIADDRRRDEVSTLLADHGMRVNYSVFECELDRQTFAKLRERLARLVDAQEDRIVFYRLCKDCRPRKSTIGAAFNATGGTGVIMV